MAQNTTLTLAANTWTQLTDGNVTAMRVCNFGTEGIWLQATVGATPPTNTNGGLPLLPGQVMAADLTLADLWPGVSGANRVYAFSPVAAKVSVSNA
jgi:hypothetical protein